MEVLRAHDDQRHEARAAQRSAEAAEVTRFGHASVACARRVGWSRPLHLALSMRLLVQATIRQWHMEQIALAMPLLTPSPRV